MKGLLYASEVTLPTWLSLSSDGLLQGTPTNENVGDHKITVRVTDEAKATAEKSFNLTVNNDDPPILQPFSGDQLQYDFIEGEVDTANTILKDSQQTPAVTALPNGETVVIWSSSDLHQKIHQPKLIYQED